PLTGGANGAPTAPGTGHPTCSPSPLGNRGAAAGPAPAELALTGPDSKEEAMAVAKRAVVVGVFDSHDHAQQAVHELRRLGFREDQIGVAARSGEKLEGATTTADRGENAAAGAGIGAAAGAGPGRPGGGGHPA